MSIQDIENLKAAWGASVLRAVEIGFDVSFPGAVK